MYIKKGMDNMERIDMNGMSQEEIEFMREQSKLLFKFNHTEPMTEEYVSILNELLDGNIGENSSITTPFAGDFIKLISIFFA